MSAESHRRAQAKYQASPEQKKKRAARNRARRLMIKAGKARKGDGKDVEHIDGNALNTPKKGTKNLRMGSRKHNRSFPRKKDGSKKNPRD